MPSGSGQPLPAGVNNAIIDVSRLVTAQGPSNIRQSPASQQQPILPAQPSFNSSTAQISQPAIQASSAGSTIMGSSSQSFIPNSPTQSGIQTQNQQTIRTVVQVPLQPQTQTQVQVQAQPSQSFIPETITAARQQNPQFFVPSASSGLGVAGMPTATTSSSSGVSGIT